MTDKIELTLEKKNGVLIFRVCGRLDSVSSRQFEKQFTESLEDEDCDKVLMNLEMLNYMSRSGLRFLSTQTKSLKEKNIRLVICSVNKNIMDVIKMVGFDNILNIQDTEKEGLTAF
ncbi:MAG: anti-anti-sigma factor [Chlamydiales bacterium]|jgi:anti-anti-sigma factor